MKIIEILTKIANDEELPEEIYYNGDYGELIQDEYVTNYLMHIKNSRFEFYWLIGHRLDNLNDEVELSKRRIYVDTSSNKQR